MRGREHLRRGALDDAARELAAALELSPTFAAARIGLALTQARSGKPGDAQRAAQSLRTGLDRAAAPSERSQLYEALGEVLITGGDYSGAEAAFAQASQLGASRALHDRLARLRAKTGRYADAIGELMRAARVK